MSGTRHGSGVIAAALAALCWGIATVLSKDALTAVAPLLLLVLQLAVSVAALWTVVALRGSRAPQGKSVLQFAWLGVLEPGLAYLLGLVGLTDVAAGGSTLIQSSEAIMIVVVSALLLGEKPTARFVLMSLLAFLGISIALGFITGDAFSTNGATGTALIFTATACAAFYVVLSSRVATTAAPEYIVAWQQTVGLAFALVALGVERAIYPSAISLPTTTTVWALVGVSGILQFALGFAFYMRALGSISANVAGCFLNLTPVFGLAGAFVLRGERLSGLQLAGAAITIISVMFISFQGAHPEPDSSAKSATNA